MTQHREQRVLVLFDVQNLYYSGKHLYNQKVNFKEILKKAVAGRKLIRAIAYVIKTEIKEESVFHEALENIGIEVKAKDIQIFVGGAKKGDWDIGIAMDAVRIAPKVDAVVLVSGDGDFRDLVLYLQGHGVRVEGIAFKETSSSRLREVVDSFTDLSSDKKRYLLPGGSCQKGGQSSSSFQKGSSNKINNKTSNNNSNNQNNNQAKKGPIPQKQNTQKFDRKFDQNSKPLVSNKNMKKGNEATVVIVNNKDRAREPMLNAKVSPYSDLEMANSFQPEPKKTEILEEKKVVVTVDDGKKKTDLTKPKTSKDSKDPKESKETESFAKKVVKKIKKKVSRKKAAKKKIKKNDKSSD